MSVKGGTPQVTAGLGPGSSAGGGLADVLDGLLDLVTRSVPESAALLWLKEHDNFRLAAHGGFVGRDSGPPTNAEFGACWLRRLAAIGELVCGDTQSHPCRTNRDWMVRGRFAASVSIPLIAGEALIGLFVCLTRRKAITPKQADQLRRLAAAAALVIDDQRRGVNAQRERDTTEALAQVNRVISRSLDPERVAQLIVDNVEHLFVAEAAVLYRWVSELNGLEALALAGDWGPVLDDVVFPSRNNVVQQALAGRRPLYGLSGPLEPSSDREASVQPTRSLLVVPLIMHERIIGALGIGRRSSERFDTDEIRLAQMFGDQAAIAFENARLFDEQAEHLASAQHRRARLEALVELNRAVSTLQPLSLLLRHIAETCGRLLGTDSVGIRLADGDELVVAHALGDAAEVMATPRLKIGQSLTGLVAASGQTLVIADPANHPRLLPAHREAMERLGYHAFVGVPIKVGDVVAGVLGIQTRRHTGFSEEDIALVNAFAGQAGVALHNSRLYESMQEAVQQLAQTQDQLLQSQKMDAVGRLAGGIAHDFNNLLTVITGQSQLLLRTVESPPIREGIERISLTSDRAAELTRQLLAFSRKQILRPQIMQVNEIANELEPMLRRIIGEDVRLSTALDAELASVNADPSQLRQVIMNLAVNARDAMPYGGALTIETRNVSFDTTYTRSHPEVAAGRYVMLAVSDTGLGMDAETRRRLFEPFYTTKPPGQGTGLGLAMVYGIVKQSGGHIWVYSEPGRGTTFKIYLPAAADGAAPAEVPAAGGQPPIGSETILVVEDEADVRRLVRRILEEQGYRVLEAANPAEALELGIDQPEHIDLLLTDVVMPQMSGRVLADLMTDGRQDLAVLFMSGYADNAIVQHGVLAAEHAYIDKPFSPDALARIVRRTLDTHRRHSRRQRDEGAERPTAHPASP